MFDFSAGFLLKSTRTIGVGTVALELRAGAVLETVIVGPAATAAVVVVPGIEVVVGAVVLNKFVLLLVVVVSVALVEFIFALEYALPRTARLLSELMTLLS